MASVRATVVSVGATRSSRSANASTSVSRRTSRANLIPKAVNILDLNKESKKDFFTSFDIVFCACDGVVWMMAGAEIEKTGPALVLLKEWGKEIVFVSNNSMRKDKDYVERFNALGLVDINPNNIILPVKIISRYLKRNMAKKKILSLCSREMNEVFKRHEITVKIMKPELGLCTENLLEKISPEDKFDAIVMDINFNLTFGELMRAHQYLLNDNCVLLVGASDSRLPISKGFRALGSEGFLNMLVQNTGQEPLVFGKPGAQLAEYLLERFKLTENPSRALFIGDNLKTDIAFGVTYHFQTLFVPTGPYTLDDAKKLSETWQPDYYAKSLADFIEFFEEIKALKTEWRRDSEIAEELSNQHRESAVSGLLPNP